LAAWSRPSSERWDCCGDENFKVRNDCEGIGGMGTVTSRPGKSDKPQFSIGLPR
jgi:hypothetical protein